MLSKALNMEELAKQVSTSFSVFKAGYDAANAEATEKSTPKKAYVNSKTNEYVLVWGDGTTTKATCCKEDHFDPIVGFAIAYCVKAFGSKTKFKNKVKELTKANKKEEKKEEK